MTSFVFDVSLGKVAYYAELPGATDSLIIVPFVSGDDDDALRVKTNLADISASNSESSIGRLTAATTTVTAGRASLTTPTNGWATPAAGPTVTRVVIFYKPDDAALPSAIIPLVSLDVNFTPTATADVAMLFDPFFVASAGAVGQAAP